MTKWKPDYDSAATEYAKAGKHNVLSNALTLTVKLTTIIIVCKGIYSTCKVSLTLTLDTDNLYYSIRQEHFQCLTCMFTVDVFQHFVLCLNVVISYGWMDGWMLY